MTTDAAAIARAVVDDLAGLTMTYSDPDRQRQYEYEVAEARVAKAIQGGDLPMTNQHSGADIKALEARLRERLPGISSPVMRGDNLAITLASYFEPIIEDDEMDESETWKQGAIDASNEVMDAIHAHYADTIAALWQERDEARRKLFPYADATSISGMSWNGFYLIGDDKSIKELKRIEHRSAQLEEFSKAYEESAAREKARLEEAKALVARNWCGRHWRGMNDTEASKVNDFLHQGGSDAQG